MKESKKNEISKFIRIKNVEKYIAPLLLVGLIIILSLLSPYFLSINNLLNLGRQTSIALIIAIGQNFVILSAGIDLSVGSIVGLSTCVLGLLYSQNGINIWLASIVAIIFGLAAGIFNGLVVTKANVPPFIATLGSMGLFRGVTLLMTKGYPTGLGYPETFRFIGEGQAPLMIAAIVSIIGWFILTKTIIGRFIYAVGDNERAAKFVGIDLNKVRMFVFVFSGLLSSIGGVILAARLNASAPTAGTGMELNSIAAVVIGGTDLFGGQGNIIGTIIGAFLMSTIANGLNLLGISRFLQDVLIGGFIIIAVMINRVSFSGQKE